MYLSRNKLMKKWRDKKDFPDFWGKIKKKIRGPHAKEKQSNRLVHCNHDFNTNDWSIISVFRFDNYFKLKKWHKNLILKILTNPARVTPH